MIPNAAFNTICTSCNVIEPFMSASPYSIPVSSSIFLSSTGGSLVDGSSVAGGSLTDGLSVTGGSLVDGLSVTGGSLTDGLSVSDGSLLVSSSTVTF